MADYESDTTHLSMMEHGAYRLLLDHYYKKRRPLPANASLLHRICRAFASDEQTAVQTVLDEFFILESDGYHQKRADKEIGKAIEISAKRTAAANAKWRAPRELPKKVESRNGHRPAPEPVQVQSKCMEQEHASADANALQVDTHLTTHISQEEGGEKKPLPAKAQPKKKRTPSLLTSAPDLLPVTSEMRAWGAEKFPDLEPELEVEKFLEKARAKAWKFANWTAAWQSWMRNAKKFADADAQKNGTAPLPRVPTLKEKLDRERMAQQ